MIGFRIRSSSISELAILISVDESHVTIAQYLSPTRFRYPILLAALARSAVLRSGVRSSLEMT